MGLLVTGYSNLKATNMSIKEFEDLDDRDGLVRFCINEEFPGRNGEIQEGIVYTYDDCFSFDCSYSNYNYWRSSLAEVAKYPANYDHKWESISADLPFYSLIYFSDCEGVIGLEYCQKLAKEFLQYQNDAKAYSDLLASDMGWYFLERYENFKKVFDLASQNGAVKFS